MLMDHTCPDCGDTCDCLWPEDCRHCESYDGPDAELYEKLKSITMPATQLYPSITQAIEKGENRLAELTHPTALS